MSGESVVSQSLCLTCRSIADEALGSGALGTAKERSAKASDTETLLAYETYGQ